MTEAVNEQCRHSKQLIEALQEAVNVVGMSPKASCGSYEDIYSVQVNVSTVERWRATLALVEGGK